MAKVTSSTPIPKTLEEFINSPWFNFACGKLAKWNFRDLNNSQEDLVQDMLAQMHKYQYIESYDPAGRPFGVYISVFIGNLLNPRFKKEVHSKNGHKILGATSLVSSSSEEDFTPGESVLERMAETGKDDDYSFILIESLRKDLDQFKATSSVVKDGVTYNRDPNTVLTLLMAGLSVAEIAELLDTSKQFIYLLKRKIQEADSLKEYAPKHQH